MELWPRWLTLLVPMQSSRAMKITLQFLPRYLRLVFNFLIFLSILILFWSCFFLIFDQNAAQSHGGAFITPAAAAATPLTPAYAYYYSGGVMPGGYQFGAPAVLYPVSPAPSGHAASNGAQYCKEG